MMKLSEKFILVVILTAVCAKPFDENKNSFDQK
jgi:hypothetical protein